MARFHGITMVGRFLLQKLSGLPPFSSDRDSGRLVYSDDNCTGYVGTPDGWVPITGVQKVSSLPNWRVCLIGRLFFHLGEQQLYIGTAGGFQKAGVTEEEGVIDYSTAVCMQCDPPSGTMNVNDTYVVCASGSTDAWAGEETNIALWDGSSWIFSEPTDYQRVLIGCESSYYVWVESEGEWKDEVEATCFNYTDTKFYPKTDDNIPLSGAFFEEDVNKDLMPVDVLPGYINEVWEKDGPSAVMPRP